MTLPGRGQGLRCRQRVNGPSRCNTTRSQGASRPLLWCMAMRLGLPGARRPRGWLQLRAQEGQRQCATIFLTPIRTFQQLPTAAWESAEVIQVNCNGGPNPGIGEGSGTIWETDDKGSEADWLGTGKGGTWRAVPYSWLIRAHGRRATGCLSCELEPGSGGTPTSASFHSRTRTDAAVGFGNGGR